MCYLPWSPALAAWRPPPSLGQGSGEARVTDTRYPVYGGWSTAPVVGGRPQLGLGAGDHVIQLVLAALHLQEQVTGGVG